MVTTGGQGSGGMGAARGTGAGGAVDPVLARRARIGRLAKVGKRAGYSSFLVAMIAFLIGAVADFPAPVVTVVIVSLLAGSILLAPAIVAGYGVRAAEREDRGLPPSH